MSNSYIGLRKDAQNWSFLYTNSVYKLFCIFVVKERREDKAVSFGTDSLDMLDKAASLCRFVYTIFEAARIITIRKVYVLFDLCIVEISCIFCYSHFFDCIGFVRFLILSFFLVCNSWLDKKLGRPLLLTCCFLQRCSSLTAISWFCLVLIIYASVTVSYRNRGSDVNT